jgi:quinol-cytochrome oxidoreductase complex cytochrome b subunit
MARISLARGIAHQFMVLRSHAILRFQTLRVSLHSPASLVGITLILTFSTQLLSGILVGLSLLNTPLMIPNSRSSEDQEDLYTDDAFWLHERGVDWAFILIYCHMFRKVQIGSFNVKQEGAWKSGAILLLLLHVVTFFGLVLCCTHLSEVTLTIAANILHSILMKKTKIYWWLFPNQTLNVDTTIRLMYLHYVTAFVFFILALYHSLEMHYDWKDGVQAEENKNQLAWLDDAIKNELLFFVTLMVSGGIFTKLNYTISEPACTELFMWGDVGAVSEIRFFGVTPHWYFRAYMSWLVVCPHHYLGLGGLVYFMVSFYFQPQVKKIGDLIVASLLWLKSNVSSSLVLTFVMTILYGASYLAYGKFYNRLGGNPATLASFSYVFIFLSLPMSYWLWKTHATISTKLKI